MKRRLLFLSTALGVLTAVSANALETKAKNAILMDFATGKVLFEKNADEPMPPASMSKLMTAYVIFDRLKKGLISEDDVFVVSNNAWRKGGIKTGSSTMFLNPKDKVTVHDLLRGIIVQSGNDACITAAENIVLGIPPEEDGGRRLDMKAVARRVREICARYGFDIEPDQKVYEMTVSQKQTLEIVKVLYRGADILILDEPTAVLTPQETEKLFGVMREMKKDGCAVVIITHKLHEVLSISDRVAILRKGEYIGDVKTSEATELSLTEMMVGKKVALDIERPEPVNPSLRLSVKNLTVYGAEGVPALKDAAFDLYGGEILGIAGVSGCGSKELLEATRKAIHEAKRRQASSIRIADWERRKATEELCAELVNARDAGGLKALDEELARKNYGAFCPFVKAHLSLVNFRTHGEDEQGPAVHEIVAWAIKETDQSLLVDGLKTFSQEEKIAVQLRGNLQNANEPWRRRLVWLMDSNGQNRPKENKNEPQQGSYGTIPAEFVM